MEIKCTVQEFKELLKKEVPVAGTTGVRLMLEGKSLSEYLDEKIEKEQTESKSECSINSPQKVLDDTISEILAIDDKHTVD